MFTTFHRRSLAALLAGLAFAALPAPTFATHAWGSYHWARTSTTFTLHLGDNVSGAWNSFPDYYLNTASNDWSKSSVLDTPISWPGGTRPRNCRPTSGRVEVCSYGYGNTGWLGLAQIWISGSHITQGVTKLNDSYFKPGSMYNTPAWRRLVMCQEVGHTLGLDHQNEVFNNTNLGTCMDYTNDPDGTGTLDNNEHPNAHDYAQLETIYAHTDSTTTVNQTVNKAPAAANDEFSRPAQFGTAQWGKLIRSTNGGRTERYELDFGGGHKLFTFVIWAESEQ